jgi:aryl-alcohol dehydrogenase-like predicted oxidoreductase
MSNPDVTAPLVAPRPDEQFAAVVEALAINLHGDERAELAGLFNAA